MRPEGEVDSRLDNCPWTMMCQMETCPEPFGRQRFYFNINDSCGLGWQARPEGIASYDKMETMLNNFHTEFEGRQSFRVDDEESAITR